MTFFTSLLVLLLPLLSGLPLHAAEEFDGQKWIQALGDSYWQVFQSKLTLLHDNYIHDFVAGDFRYLSLGGEGCKKPNGSPNELNVVFQILFGEEFSPNRDHADLKIEYRGCSQEIMFTEHISRRGKNLKGFDPEKILLGVREYSLEENETEKTLTLRDGADVTLAEVVLKIPSANKIEARLALLGQPMAAIDWDKMTSRMVIVREPYEIVYNSAHFKSQMDSSNRYELEMDMDGGALRFWVGGEEELSKTSFNSYFEHAVEFVFRNFLGELIKSFEFDIPETQFAGGAAATSRILDELRLALTRLDSKTDLDKVRLLILEYIDAIETGKIGVMDNRPKN